MRRRYEVPSNVLLDGYSNKQTTDGLLPVPSETELAIDYRNSLASTNGTEPFRSNGILDYDDGVIENSISTYSLTCQIDDEDGLWAGIGTTNISAEHMRGTLIGEHEIIDETDEYVEYRATGTLVGVGHWANIGESEYIIAPATITGSCIIEFSRIGTFGGEFRARIDGWQGGGPWHHIGYVEEGVQYEVSVTRSLTSNGQYSLYLFCTSGNLTYIDIDYKIYKKQLEFNNLQTPYVYNSRKDYHLRYRSDLKLSNGNFSVIYKFKGEYNGSMWSNNEVFGILCGDTDQSDVLEIYAGTGTVGRINDAIVDGINTLIATVDQNGTPSNIYINGIDCGIIRNNIRADNYDYIVFNRFHDRTNLDQYAPNNYQLQNLLIRRQLTDREIEVYSQNKLFDIPNNGSSYISDTEKGDEYGSTYQMYSLRNSNNNIKLVDGTYTTIGSDGTVYTATIADGILTGDGVVINNGYVNVINSVGFPARVRIDQ